MDSQALIQSDLDHVWHHVMPMHEVAESGPKVIVRGEGSLVWDVEGKEYLDAMGGIYTTPIGHGRADVIEAICEQGRKLEFYPNFQFYTTPPVIELAEKLTALYPADMKRWFFCSGGSEAMDTALKIARQYWKQSGKPGKHKFIALRGGFHGVTFGAASATGITLYREPYEPLVPGFRHVPAPFCYRCPCKETYPGCCLKCVDALEQQIVFEHPDTVAAFIAEPVINPIGEVPPPVEYYQRVRELCDRYQVL
ncbi:MAG: aminotransferase class III-fold pyridoxal phosphate-dependent enzyme, partial [Armatimonadetes bacterium]|nr:aminotransferase class III-fold pyridoxal phosphate-dependent enzyme [Armatimonadota bacterium]